MWGTFLSEPLRIVALVGRCPANQLMRRMPIPDRRIFHTEDMHPLSIWGIRPSFPGLSPCPGQVAYVLLTSAPVAASGIATTALPLDLHVLSLSLAFILSQDQTLRCCMIVFSFTRIIKKPQRRSVARPGPRPTPKPGPPHLGSAVLVCTYLSLRNLDVDTGFPFLVSALSIFLIANISMISRHRPEKASKKSLTQS